MSNDSLQFAVVTTKTSIEGSTIVSRSSISCDLDNVLNQLCKYLAENRPTGYWPEQRLRALKRTLQQFDSHKGSWK